MLAHRTTPERHLKVKVDRHGLSITRISARFAIIPSRILVVKVDLEEPGSIPNLVHAKPDLAPIEEQLQADSRLSRLRSNFVRRLIGVGETRFCQWHSSRQDVYASDTIVFLHNYSGKEALAILL